MAEGEEKCLEAASEKFADMCKRKVGDMMSKEVVCVTDETNFLDFADMLEKYAYKGFPVVDNKDKIVGIVTWSDLLKLMLFHGCYGAKLVECSSFIGQSTIRAIRSNNAITLSPEDTIEEAAHLMFENNIQTIPIVENGRIVGIVGKKDIIKEILRILRQDKTHQ
ncbi:MAG: hypothetical protein MSIBF_00845 [Candidatus Altiarchaeales archaeon IMC4]|nr:MAG: hypothetical protein MSIBF_00845 [Candidatus Altiarchaeales archaeon IMC4]